MEIIRIAISKLFHAEFLSMLKKVKEIVTLHNPNNNATIDASNTVVGNEIPILEKVLSADNGSLFTEALQAADHKRDDMVVGLGEVLSGQCKNPDEAFSKHAILLRHVMDGYGIIASDSNDSESSKIDALIKDFTTIPENFAAINALGLKNWIDSLQIANNDFKEIALKRINEAAKDTLSSFTVLRKKATTNFEALTKTINSLAYVDNTGSFNNLINEMNAMLEEYAQKIAIRKGIKAAAAEKKKNS